MALTPDERPHDPGPTVHPDGVDPILQGLAGRPKTEEDLRREAERQAQRAAERAQRWIRRYRIRFGLVVGGYALAVVAIANFYAASWHDAVLLPLFSAGLCAAATYLRWPWLLTGVLLTLVPLFAVLLLGGTVSVWFFKVPVLGGLAMLAGYATEWPTAED